MRDGMRDGRTGGMGVALCGVLLATSLACGGDGAAGDSLAADTAMPTMGAADSMRAGAPGAMSDPIILAQISVANAAEIAAGNAARAAAQHAELRALIDAAIPKVQQHLDRAREIRTALGDA